MQLKKPCLKKAKKKFERGKKVFLSGFNSLQFIQKSDADLSFHTGIQLELNSNTIFSPLQQRAVKSDIDSAFTDNSSISKLDIFKGKFMSIFGSSKYEDMSSTCRKVAFLWQDECNQMQKTYFSATHVMHL